MKSFKVFWTAIGQSTLVVLHCNFGTPVTIPMALDLESRSNLTMCHNNSQPFFGCKSSFSNSTDHDTCV